MKYMRQKNIPPINKILNKILINLRIPRPRPNSAAVEKSPSPLVGEGFGVRGNPGLL